MPDNITIVPLPAKCPELNPVENVAVHPMQLALQPRVRFVPRVVV